MTSRTVNVRRTSQTRLWEVCGDRFAPANSLACRGYRRHKCPLRLDRARWFAVAFERAGGRRLPRFGRGDRGVSRGARRIATPAASGDRGGVADYRRRGTDDQPYLGLLDLRPTLAARLRAARGDQRLHRAGAG